MRRADGVVMEEVIVTNFDPKKNKLSSTTSYRPVGGSQQKTQEPNLKELLGEEDDESSEETTLGAPRVQPAASKNPIMDKLTVLKICLQEGILTQEEYDWKRKEVLDEMINGGGRSANPSLQTGREVQDMSPESRRKQELTDDARYIQNRYQEVYATGHEGDARDKNLTMQMQPTGVDGVYYTGKAAEVIDVVEEDLKPRRVGPEHDFVVIKTHIRKELLDTGVVRVIREEKIYDGYSGAYKTMNKSEKMKPKLSFHETEEYDNDEEFEMRTGVSTQEDDKVDDWRADFKSEHEKEQMRVMKQGLGDKLYQSRVVNNPAGKGDLGWDGVYRYPGEKPKPEKKKAAPRKKGLFGKKKNAPKEEEEPDQWKGMDDNWDLPEDNDDAECKGRRKPGYKDGKKKGIFNVKKAQSSKKDDMMGEDPNSYKLADPTKKSAGSGEHMQDDGSGMGGFGSGEQWGAGAKQHEGKHAPGGSHFTHQDQWK